jgi:hypothetical protein
MSARDVVQVTFGEFAKNAGFSRRSASWYRTGADVITVLNLQRSQYGPKYYINIGLWLVALGEATTPKEHHCHIRTRLELLVGDAREILERLLDLGSPMGDEARASEIAAFLEVHLAPVLKASVSLESLRSPHGITLVAKSLVVGPARPVLGAAKG